MTSFDSFGDDEGIADELAESQQSISIAEFFEKNKHMLGFDSAARGLVTAVKEAVDNALDACEEADIRPNVYVEIEEVGDYYRLVVEDNGPGITADSLPKVFGKLLYGSRFHVREQNRGQQGIGISAAVLHSQKTSGKPAKITSRTKGSERAKYFELIVDTETNEPEITVEEELDPGSSPLGNVHGTRIELEMEANMRARSRLHDYVEQTAVVNPHATLTLDEPGLDEPRRFDRATDRLPDETEEIRPHPHGVELGTLVSMLEATDSYSVSGFLQEEFTRVGKKTAEKVLDAFRDRHFGRELGWSTPAESVDADADVEAALVAAVANKGAAATEAFADRVATALRERERTTRQGVAAVVDEAADGIETEFDRTFGDTVRDNAITAAWAVLTGYDPDSGQMDEDRLRPNLYAVVDDATTVRKDDAAVAGLAERLARKFAAGHPRSRFTRDELVKYVDAAADATEEYDDATFGETARENVVTALWERMETVTADPPSVSETEADRDAAAELLAAMRATDILAPPTDCLSPITAGLVEEGLRKEYDADFYAAASRDAEVHGGDPFVVEAGIAYGGEIGADGQIDVLRFANRVPLVYQRGACATTDVVKEIGWRNYGLDQSGGRGIPTGAAVILVHVASTNVPFTSESKDAVANVPEIEDEIELAIREAARELKSYLKRQRSMAKRREKQEVLGSILPAMAEKVAAVTDRERPEIRPAMARIMNNVAVERDVDGGEVTLRVENHSDRSECPDVTDIVTAEPESLPEGVTTVEMDGEWVVKWNPEVPAGETAELSYAVDDDAEFTVDVDDVESAKLTIDA